MLVYVADKKQFLHDCDYQDIEEIIREKFKQTTGKNVAPAEIRSWQSSLGYVAKALRDDEIAEDIGVAVELHIPQSSKRIDVTLSGFNAEHEKNIVVIELKQWEKAAKSLKDGIVITQIGRGYREVVHPSYQAWSYATLLEGFNEAVYDGGIHVQPCAYSHRIDPS